MTILQQYNILKNYLQGPKFKDIRRVELTKNIELFTSIDDDSHGIAICEERRHNDLTEKEEHLIEFSLNYLDIVSVMMNNKKGEFFIDLGFQTKLVNHTFTSTEISVIYKALNYIVSNITNEPNDIVDRLNKIIG